MSGDSVNRSRLEEEYIKEIVSQLQKEFGIKNKLAVPKIEKIVINVGVGEITHDKTAMEKAISSLTAITGQYPSLRKAKKAIAEFKMRQGDVVGLKITLRKKRMYQFLDKLFTIVLPRVRDFQGTKKTSFDKKGNYTLGLGEQIIFPETDYDKIDKVRGMEITIVSNTNDVKKAERLLELLGMPFEKTQKETE